MTFHHARKSTSRNRWWRIRPGFFAALMVAAQLALGMGAFDHGLDQVFTHKTKPSSGILSGMQFGLGAAGLSDNSLADDKQCLAMNIYHEGRSEPVEGKLAIAAVTMNRVVSRHYPETVCGVVWQPRQFSWTNLKQKYHRTENNKAWQQALELADLFIHGATWHKVGDARHYHSNQVNPEWSDESKIVARLGNHVFYRL